MNACTALHTGAPAGSTSLSKGDAAGQAAKPGRSFRSKRQRSLAAALGASAARPPLVLHEPSHPKQSPCLPVLVRRYTLVVVVALLLLAPQPAACFGGGAGGFDWRHAMAAATLEQRHLADLHTSLLDDDHAHALPYPEAVGLFGLATAAEGRRRRRQLLQTPSQPRPNATDLLRAVRSKCRLARGSWCGQYELQRGIPYRPAPRGSTSCPANCSGMGNCDFDTGRCHCPAGWTGADCSELQLRPCTNRKREAGNISASHIDALGRDLDWEAPGWMANRCPGICDASIAACYCDGPKYGHIPAPLGSPPGTPPVRTGRMLGHHCQPKTTPEGDKAPWGGLDLAEIYGPEGWCVADKPIRSCGCTLDGHHGKDCEQRHEMYCPNQCSGRGVCWLGFCKCHEGYYGTDCARKRAGAGDVEPVVWGANQSHLEAVVDLPPEATAPQPPPGTLRKRPLIYVYDVPPQYTTRMLQYRTYHGGCIHREWGHSNEVLPKTLNVYALETYLHEAMLQSEHRTFDPEAADFFYVPAYICCWTHPVYAQADYPWWAGPLPIRVLHAANMLLELKRHLQSVYPFWNRTQGRDHIWLAAHDEGACWFPTEVYENSIILTHWGRLELAHTSNTAYERDNYTRPLSHPEWTGGQDWRKVYLGHACYTPGKDLVVPSFKWPVHYNRSALLRAPAVPRRTAPVPPTGAAVAPSSILQQQQQRDVLLYFRGDVGANRLAWYSRRIRQTLYRLSQQHGWRDKHAIWIGSTHDLPGSYSESLARSTFCLVVPGDGWSSRAEDSILHGCIPVVIMDDVHAVFESILDWDLFSVRVREGDLQHLPQILESIPEDRIARMQRRIERVWHRFAYTRGRVVRSMVTKELVANARAGVSDGGIEGAAAAWVEWEHWEDDALGTILQWLYAKMPQRGEG